MYIIYFASDSKRACARHGGLRFLKHDFILKPPNLYYHNIMYTTKSTYNYYIHCCMFILYNTIAMLYRAVPRLITIQDIFSEKVRQAFSYNISIYILDCRSERRGKLDVFRDIRIFHHHTLIKST